MIRGENSDSIPIDLVIEIFLRLPVKSIGRCRCVSKLWGSMLSTPYFTDLFMTRSSPRLLFAVGSKQTEWRLLSSPQPHDLYDEKSSSLVVTADFYRKFPRKYCTFLEICGHASGLISFRPQKRGRENTVICNPSTGQYVILPLPRGRKDNSLGWRSFLGFDPIGKQFKVLSISFPRYDRKFAPVQILTLGSGKHSWRKIPCPIIHFPGDYFSEGICINGVLYYLAADIDDLPYMIVCFDVRSEKFKFIYRELYRDFIIYRMATNLINYKGKLGVVTLTRDDYPGNLISIRLCLWDVENLESSEWSEIFSYNWDSQGCYMSIVGATTTGEVVLSNEYTTNKPFYVYYWNPERKTFQSVQIRGFETTSEKDFRTVKVFLDHVEDLKFIPMENTYAATSTSTSSKAHLQQDGRMFESINKFYSPRPNEMTRDEYISLLPFAP